MTLTLNCPVNEVNKLQQIINDTGTLTLGQGCSAHSAAITLPAHDTIARQPPLTIIPALRPTQQRWLENMSKTTSSSSIGRDRPFLLDDKMSTLQPLQPEHVEQPQTSSVWLWLTVGLTLLLCFLAPGLHDSQPVCNKKC